MASSHLAPVMHLLRQLAERDADGDITDVQLLRRFTKFGDEAAFTTLLHRHGPMVCGICRRILGNDSDADDVSQATFLVLIRRVRSIRRHTSLGSWLHGVALRLAMRVRSDAARRRHHETSRRLESPSKAHDSDIRPIIDEELARLNEKYRAPLVLCYLEGKTNDQAARQLGVPPGTVCGRLARARNMLRSRLTRRGLAPALIATAFGLSSRQLLANVPTALAGATTRLATLLATAETLTGASASVAGLVEGMMKTLFVGKVKLAALVLLAAGVVGTGAGVLARQALVKPNEERAVENAVGAQERPANNPRRVDRHGDPLPAEAVVRLGTLRFRLGDLAQVVRFTPDARRIVVHGAGGVRVFDAKTGAEVYSLPKESAGMHVSLSPNGKLVATASVSGVHIWDADAGNLIRSIPNGKPIRVQFSPDGANLAVVNSFDQFSVELFQVETGHRQWSWRQENTQPVEIQFMPNGKTLVIGTCGMKTERDKRIIYLLDAMNGREQSQIDPGSVDTEKIAVSPDGSLLAVQCRTRTGDFDDSVRIWEVPAGKARHTLRSPPEEDATRQKVFSAMLFTRDSKSLITSGGSDGLVFWDMASGNEQKRLGRELTNSNDLCFSPDGEFLAVARDADIQIVNVESGANSVPVAGHDRGVFHALITPAGKTAVTTGGALVEWDLETGEERIRHVPERKSAFDHWMGIAPDGLTAFRTHNAEKALYIRDLATGKESDPLPLDHDGQWAWLAGISPDSRRLAFVDPSQNTIQLCDAKTGKVEMKLHDPELKVKRLHFTQDGQTLVAACADHTVQVWNTRTGTKIRQLGPLGQVRSRPNQQVIGGGGIGYKSTVSPDGRIIAAGSNARTLVLFDTTTGEEVRQSEPFANGVDEMVFSPDGRSLACTQWREPTIHVVETATLKMRCSLQGHRGSPNTFSFSNDGKRLISGSNDTTALVWDLTGRLSGGPDWGKPLSDAQLATAWTDLGGDDAAKAYQAIRRLAASPDTAVPHLAKQLAPVPPVDAAKVAGLIGDLDSDKFEVRERAFAELQKIGEAAYDPLERTKAEKPSEETRRRVELLIDAIRKQRTNPTGDLLRALRAIETLEFAGTPAALMALERIATGAPTATQTQNAKESLVRLRKGS